MEFLAENNFDLNSCIYEGIRFDEAKVMIRIDRLGNRKKDNFYKVDQMQKGFE